MAKTKVHGEFLKDSVVRFTAKAGENITKGQAVYISGISGEVPVVSLADADDTAKMPAFGLAEATVSTNAEVEITSFGTLKGLDTSSYSLGDILYVDTTAGSLTNNPSGLEATKLQNIGIVQRVHATSGSIKVGGAGRTNAVPNLDDGDIFIGDSNNKAISDSFTNVLNTEAGINSSADATAITIDSSENIGIGTSSPANKLEIEHGTVGTGNGSNNTLALRYNSTTLYGQHYMDGNGIYHVLADNNGSAGGNLQLNADSSLRFATGSTPTERMRIDSSGNVLVGTSDNIAHVTSSSGEGIALSAGSYGGFIGATRNQDVVMQLNRTGNDGDIVRFAKDGVQIGQIGTYGNTTYIGSTAGGIMFNGTDIEPTSGSTGRADNSIDLGSANYRFKDAFLGDGVYLGGTGAANKLDDYEEGTYTPSTTGLTGVTLNHCGYTKIGRLVSVDLRIQWTGSDQTNNALKFGLPFTVLNPSGSNTANTGAVFYQGTAVFSGAPLSAHAGASATTMEFYRGDGGNFTPVWRSSVNGTYDWLVSFTYFTDS